MAEAEAIREALTRGLEFGFVKVAMESDSLSLIKMLNKEGAWIWRLKDNLDELLNHLLPQKGLSSSCPWSPGAFKKISYLH
ncbi:hypothetical protein GBA52_007012 [Prunus armeniaca]|nr:hypothetical protein GBA52_007012 [Prunus armeniaca]